MEGTPVPRQISVSVPEAVGRLASERGLGAFADVRREVGTVEALVKGWGIAAVVFALIRVEAADGTSFAIPLALTDGRDPFIDRIVDALRAHGRPIS